MYKPKAEVTLRQRDEEQAEKIWQSKPGWSKLGCDTVAAGFQRTFLVSEAFRESSWRFNGAGVMPAPYCFQLSSWPGGVILTTVQDALEPGREHCQ
jgi:hypothetical protein